MIYDLSQEQLAKVRQSFYALQKDSCDKKRWALWKGLLPSWGLNMWFTPNSGDGFSGANG